ncbi:MAG: magnesium transporter [Pseudomonadales bacterium]
MKTRRHFFIGEDLDDLEAFQHDLEQEGITTAQIQVMTLDDEGARARNDLNEVRSLMKRDVIHTGEYGLVAGVIAAVAVLAVTYLAGWHQAAGTWVPFIFLAIIVLGFLTWEGGFIGFQTFNRRFEAFKGELEQGRHLLFVDITRDQLPALERASRNHPRARSAGTGRAKPHWLVRSQHHFSRLFREELP